MYLGGPASNCTTYRVATPSTAGGFLLPLGQVHTGALSVDTSPFIWIDIGGALVIPPGSWASIAASATLTTAVMQLGMIWEEVPV